MKVSIQIEGSRYTVEMRDCCGLTLTCPQCGHEVNVKPETVEDNVVRFNEHTQSCEVKA